MNEGNLEDDFIEAEQVRLDPEDAQRADKAREILVNQLYYANNPDMEMLRQMAEIIEQQRGPDGYRLNSEAYSIPTAGGQTVLRAMGEVVRMPDRMEIVRPVIDMLQQRLRELIGGENRSAAMARQRREREEKRGLG